MKWLPRSIQSILLAISVTSFSATFLYILFKKKKDDADNNRKFSREDHINIQIKIPKHVVPVIIGRNGSTIRSIQEKSNTYIHIIGDVQLPERICIIKSDKIENIHLANSIIEDIIENHPMVYVREIRVRHDILDRIVRQNSDLFDEIQNSDTSNVTLIWSHKSDGSKLERNIRITGDTDQVESVFKKIENFIKENEEIQTQLKRKSSTDDTDAIDAESESTKTVFNDDVGMFCKNFNFPAISIEDDLMVYVSALETPSSFWIQIINNTTETDALDTLMSKMTEYYDVEENRKLHTLRRIKPGQMVAVRLNYDKWYRGKVIIAEITRCKVCFVDYGYREFIPIENVLELRTDMLSLPLQAIECSLANVKPTESKWSIEACNKFVELVKPQKILVAKIRGYNERYNTEESCQEDSMMPCIDLYDTSTFYNKDINIGEYLVHLGLAQFDKKVADLPVPLRKHHPPLISSSRKMLLKKQPKEKRINDLYNDQKVRTVM